MELAMTNGFSELSFNEMEMVDGGKFSFSDICKGVITGVCSVGGGIKGGQMGAAAGSIGGPAGTIIGGAIGFVGGCIICNLLIKD